eukprot:SAG31_NODE_45526_length_258_cov_0.981132_1_plen_42_part_01
MTSDNIASLIVEADVPLAAQRCVTLRPGADVLRIAGWPWRPH